MALDKELLDILACPNCRGDVEYREQEQVIVCVGAYWFVDRAF